jgi:pyruvate/2-oxoglutarate dehydrogenase complex dihydrolipoamide dehydrogenase (E3) component
MALGSKINENVTKTMGIQLTNKKYIEVDEKYNTSLSKVLAGGDAIGKCGTVAKAARDGRNVAEEILKKY